LDLIRKHEVDELLIAIASATRKEMRRIVDLCKETSLKYRIIPGMGELIDGRLTVKAIRDVAYEDLMGRETVQLEMEKIGNYIKNKSILVTGAGGSIGSELCRQIAHFFPKDLILLDRTENNLYQIEVELRWEFPYLQCSPILGNVMNRETLTRIFLRYRPDVVFHAAAYKHVPIMELNPWETIFTNIKGTHSLLEVVKEFEVDRFVLVSTDKAVRPSNVMGASKRVAELLTQCYNNSFNPTRFMSVRFGNVIGSSGSVIPLFKRQIEKGGPITVTHPEVTRYFMTIPEAAQLILQAGSMGEGGEIFILDMGSPIKILDLARDLIRLSGFEPDEDIEIKFIGLRPGEKLYEELITEGEGIFPTSHEKISVLRKPPCDLNWLKTKIDELTVLAERQDAMGIKRKFKEILPEYEPYTPTETDVLGEP
jgi:FlaA1/EpsC-like NDP-sugar epimerase